MLKKILIGIVALLLLLVLAALVGPRFVNWNSYKDRVAAAVFQATGRALAIDGNISLALLPSPTLSVEGVRLANLPGGSSPDMARLKSLDVHVALIPLMSGRIQVTRISLLEPVILLERLADGRANWQVQPQSQTGGQVPAPSGPAGTTGGVRTLDISVDNFSIENGILIYRAGGTEQRLESINATISARSIYGPYAAQGQAMFGNLPADFQLSTAVLETGTIPIQLSLSLAGNAAVLSFEGSAEQAAGTLQGRLQAKLADPALAAKAAGVTNLPPALAQPFRISAAVTGSGTEVDLSDLSLSLGDTSASGKIAIKPGQPLSVEAALTFGRLDLDKLMPPPAAQGAAPASAGGGGTSAMPAMAGFALPGQVVANFDLSAEAVAYHKGVIDRPHISGRLADGQLQIKEMGALLPGGSDVSLAGTLAAKDAQPYFTGAVKASSDNLRDLMAWLGVSPPPVAPGRLATLKFASRVAASPSQVELSDIDLKLDAAHVQGGMAVALPVGARTKPGFGIGLTVDQLDLDAYMPPHKAGGVGAAAAAGAAAAPAKAASPLAALAGLDANFDLRAGSLILNGQAMKGLHLQGSLLDGKLTLADASAKDIGGGQGSIAGSVVGLAGDPQYDLKVALAAQDGARVFQLAGLGHPAPGKYGALKLNGALKGGSDDVSYDVAFAVTGLGIDGAAKGRAQNLKGGLPRVDSTLNLSAKNAGPLAELAGLPADAAAKIGAFTLAGKAASGTDSVDYDLTLALPDLDGKGAFKGRLTGLGGPPANAQVASDLMLAVARPTPLLILAGITGQTAGKLGALGLSGRLDGGLGKMTLDLTLALLNAKVSLTGTIAAASRPIAFDVALSVSTANGAALMTALGHGGARQAGPLSLGAKLKGDTTKFTLRDLAFKGAGSDLEGNANLDLTSGRPLFAANFGSNTLDAAAFGGAAGGNGQGQAGGQGASGGTANERWSHKPLDLSALDKADGTLEYKALHLIAGSIRIDDLATRVSLASGVLGIERLEGKIYGGGFSLQNGKLVARGLPSASGQLVAQNLEISEIAGTGTVKGPISVSSDLAASGASEAEMVSTLQGRGHLSGRIVVLPKLEQAAGVALLGALGSQLQALQGISSNVTSTLGLFAGKQSDLAGDFVIDHGVVTTDNTTLSNLQARAVSHGDVNLPPWKLAMQTDIYKAGQSGKLMTASFIGPIDKPNVGVSGLSFKPTNGLQNLLPGLLPGAQQPQTQAPQNPAPAAPSASNPPPTTNKVDPFNSLLNNLLQGGGQ
jgi:uncharacterized protein involved in outer membrane biogenesis